MFNRFLRTSAQFVTTLPFRAIFNNRTPFRPLPTPQFQFTHTAHPVIQTRLMSTISHKPTQLNLTKHQKDLLKRAITKFTEHYPDASPADIVNCESLHLLHIEQLAFTDSRDEFRIERYLHNMTIHHPDTQPAKIALLTMLNTPLDKINDTLIAKTLKKIGFKTRQAIFQDMLELYITKRCNSHEPDEKNLHCANTSTMVQKAKTVADLHAAYKHLLVMPHFQGVYESTILKFIVEGTMNPSIHGTLRMLCTYHHFANPTSVHLQENRQTFNQLQSYFLTMLPQLEMIKEELTIQPTCSFPELIKKIRSTKNIAELSNELGKQNSCLRLDDWRNLCSKVKDNPMFKDPSRLREQLYYLMTRADERGIKFDFNAEQALIEDHVEYLYWEASQWREEGEKNFGEERHSMYFLFMGKYGTTHPTDEDFLRVTLTDMKKALHLGCYQEELATMKRHIQHYHECTRYKVNPQ